MMGMVRRTFATLFIDSLERVSIRFLPTCTLRVFREKWVGERLHNMNFLPKQRRDKLKDIGNPLCIV